MKYLRVGVCLLAAFFIFNSTYIYSAEFGKIGYVNLTRVFYEYEKSKIIKKNLEEKAKSKEAERKKMVEEVRKFKDEAELLSEKARFEKQPAIDEKIKALQEFDNKTKESIAKESSESSQNVLSDIETVILDYAKKENYSVILDSEALLYGDDAFNLTDEIIKQLNASYAKAKISPQTTKENKK